METGAELRGKNQARKMESINGGIRLHFPIDVYKQRWKINHRKWKGCDRR